MSYFKNVIKHFVDTSRLDRQSNENIRFQYFNKQTSNFVFKIYSLVWVNIVIVLTPKCVPFRHNFTPQ